MMSVQPPVMQFENEFLRNFRVPPELQSYDRQTFELTRRTGADQSEKCPTGISPFTL
jgi:hypothetical protein